MAAWLLVAPDRFVCDMGTQPLLLYQAVAQVTEAAEVSGALQPRGDGTYTLDSRYHDYKHRGDAVDELCWWEKVAGSYERTTSAQGGLRFQGGHPMVSAAAEAGADGGGGGNVAGLVKGAASIPVVYGKNMVNLNLYGEHVVLHAMTAVQQIKVHAMREQHALAVLLLFRPHRTVADLRPPVAAGAGAGLPSPSWWQCLRHFDATPGSMWGGAAGVRSRYQQYYQRFRRSDPLAWQLPHGDGGDGPGGEAGGAGGGRRMDWYPDDGEGGVDNDVATANAVQAWLEYRLVMNNTPEGRAGVPVDRGVARVRAALGVGSGASRLLPDACGGARVVDGSGGAGGGAMARQRVHALVKEWQDAVQAAKPQSEAARRREEAAGDGDGDLGLQLVALGNPPAEHHLPCVVLRAMLGGEDGCGVVRHEGERGGYPTMAEVASDAGLGTRQRALFVLLCSLATQVSHRVGGCFRG